MSTGLDLERLYERRNDGLVQCSPLCGPFGITNKSLPERAIRDGCRIGLDFFTKGIFSDEERGAKERGAEEERKG